MLINSSQTQQRNTNANTTWGTYIHIISSNLLFDIDVSIGCQQHHNCSFSKKKKKKKKKKNLIKGLIQKRWGLLQQLFNFLHIPLLASDFHVLKHFLVFLVGGVGGGVEKKKKSVTFDKNKIDPQKKKKKSPWPVKGPSKDRDLDF